MKHIIRKILKEQLRLKSKETYISGVNDSEIIAATLIGEAGGEGNEGMIAVKNVLENRSSKKERVKGKVRKPYRK